MIVLYEKCVNVVVYFYYTAPDIREVNSSLRVSRIDLSGGGVAVDVTFTVSCA